MFTLPRVLIASLIVALVCPIVGVNYPLSEKTPNLSAVVALAYMAALFATGCCALMLMTPAQAAIRRRT